MGVATEELVTLARYCKARSQGEVGTGRLRTPQRNGNANRRLAPNRPPRPRGPHGVLLALAGVAARPSRPLVSATCCIAATASHARRGRRRRHAA